MCRNLGENAGSILECRVMDHGPNMTHGRRSTHLLSVSKAHRVAFLLVVKSFTQSVGPWIVRRSVMEFLPHTEREKTE